MSSADAASATEQESQRRDVIRSVDVALASREKGMGSLVPPHIRAGQRKLSNAVELFGERLRDYDATVRYVDSGDLPGALTEILAKHGASSLAVPNDLPHQWLVTLSETANVEICRDEPILERDRLKEIDGSLTACAVAIAETGTIILDGGRGQGRRMLSLLPDLLIVIVLSEQIVDGVPEAISRIDPTLPQTWISGPSATSDIELSRVKGVHGPRVLEVVVIDEDDSIAA